MGPLERKRGNQGVAVEGHWDEIGKKSSLVDMIQLTVDQSGMRIRDVISGEQKPFRRDEYRLPTHRTAYFPKLIGSN